LPASLFTSRAGGADDGWHLKAEAFNPSSATAVAVHLLVDEVSIGQHEYPCDGQLLAKDKLSTSFWIPIPVLPQLSFV